MLKRFGFAVCLFAWSAWLASAYLLPGLFRVYDPGTGRPGSSPRSSGRPSREEPFAHLGAMERAGLVDPKLERFGLFPPVLANQPWAPPVESAAEAALSWTPSLAFQVFSARRPA